jgi:phosphate transport system permease protein
MSQDHPSAKPGAELTYSLLKGRNLVNLISNGIVIGLTLIAMVPLVAVLAMLVSRGLERLSFDAFLSLPPTALETVGGGFGNALVGTLVMVGIAAMISVPLGILTAIFLAEVSPGSRLAAVSRFLIKVMTGFPSVLAGVFAYGAVVMVLGSPSAWAGGIALAILMVPTVVITAEEAMKMVPESMKLAAMGMGTTRYQMIRGVVLPTAMPSILTGVVLAVARACGETAPLLFTALFSNYWIFQDGEWHINDRTASLAVLIHKFSSSPHNHQIQLAWTAALVLVGLVLIFNLMGQVLSARRTK